MIFIWKIVHFIWNVLSLATVFWFFSNFISLTFCLSILFSFDHVLQCINEGWMSFSYKTSFGGHFAGGGNGWTQYAHFASIFKLLIFIWKMLISYEMFFFTFLLTFSNNISLNFLLVTFPFFHMKICHGGTLFPDEIQVNAISYESSFWR